MTFRLCFFTIGSIADSLRSTLMRGRRKAAKKFELNTANSLLLLLLVNLISVGFTRGGSKCALPT